MTWYIVNKHIYHLVPSYKSTFYIQVRISSQSLWQSEFFVERNICSTLFNVSNVSNISTCRSKAIRREQFIFTFEKTMMKMQDIMQVYILLYQTFNWINIEKGSLVINFHRRSEQNYVNWNSSNFLNIPD